MNSEDIGKFDVQGWLVPREKIVELVNLELSLGIANVNHFKIVRVILNEHDRSDLLFDQISCRRSIASVM